MTSKILPKMKVLSSFERAIVISIVIVLILTLFFILTEKPSEYYTSFYINPDSVSYHNNSTVTFRYGIICNEKIITPYELEIYLDKTLKEKNTFTLSPKQHIEKTITINRNVSTTKDQVRLFLSSPVSDYNLHFWIKNQVS